MKFEDLDTREQGVLEAAVDVFTNYGYRRTTMDDIARKAGMSRPALYNYFKNKETIFRTYVELFFQSISEASQLKLEEAANVVDGLAGFFDAAFVLPFKELLATPHGMELAGVNKEIAGDLTETWMLQNERLLTCWLNKCADEGSLELGDLSAGALARVLVNSVEGIKIRDADQDRIGADLMVLAEMTARAYAPKR